VTVSFNRNRRKKGRIFKIVLLGDGGVGKTALRHRFLGQGFQADYMMTVGADFAIYTTEINKEKVKLQIWDLAGQDRFKDVRTGFYQGALGALMVYDVTRKESADHLINWKKELAKNTNQEDLIIEPQIVLVANKIDLREQIPSSLSQREGKKIAKTLGKVKYIETSAKDNVNVPQAFLELANNIYNSITENN
jgi:small GTP-binding protein